MVNLCLWFGSDYNIMCFVFVRFVVFFCLEVIFIEWCVWLWCSLLLFVFRFFVLGLWWLWGRDGGGNFVVLKMFSLMKVFWLFLVCLFLSCFKEVIGWDGIMDYLIFFLLSLIVVCVLLVWFFMVSFLVEVLMCVVDLECVV